MGFDLGQLLVGLAHKGDLPVEAMAAVHEAIVSAYWDGLASTGFEATREQVVIGYVASMVGRSAFTALPFEMLGGSDTPALRDTLRQRIALTRFLLDLADRHLPPP